MAEDTLEQMDDDFGDDAMEDLLEDSLEETSNEIKEVKRESSKKKLPVKIKEVFTQIRGSKKAVIIIVASFVLFIALVAGLLLFFFGSSTKEDHQAQSSTATKGTMPSTMSRENEVIFEDIVDLEPFERIALKTSSTMGLVSINLSLELTDHRLRKQVISMEDRIRKIVIGQLSEMTWLELRNPEGKIMLKYNLLTRINSIFPKATVRNIYFTYFIMQ
ncbi:MAG: flagellar basal body-associated FliL family protein [Proteobacteria bacterium]|nr:flagellar basal body-associated FliL family protein [Pseudomonadota bacterium]MBU1584675.1 flagellar basal body-associated FliL family protein [Pseudomonadota bacterium]MBU2455127.1 flagellar basal body-associated FliL family protein [Pseudomonadota bacterium]MBU2628603.1 flagellar basal body-associated FliL family protein [Pseudomonadota bacterium]